MMQREVEDNFELPTSYKNKKWEFESNGEYKELRRKNDKKVRFQEWKSIKARQIHMMAVELIYFGLIHLAQQMIFENELPIGSTDGSKYHKSN